MPPAPSWVAAFQARYGRRTTWIIALIIMLVACGFYAVKAAEHRSAFVRWRYQVLQLWEGENIYTEMLFPNPPIMPITLYPLMTLPPVVGATLWFCIKVAMTAVAVVLCFRMAHAPGLRFPPWAEGLVLLLSLRPILSDLHHGNINLMILFLIVSTLYAWREGYNVLAGLLLALAISYKVTPALFVPYFMYKRSWRTVLATGLGMVLFLFVIPSLVLGLRFNAECLSMWWHRILSPYLVDGVSSPQEINQSMVGVLTRLLTEAPLTEGRYGRHLDVNLVAWNPGFVAGLVKGLSLAIVGLLVLFCRTRTDRRDDPRLLGEFSLVVLTMLLVSERSWKHHFVTLLLPYSYLVYRVAMKGTPWRVRAALATALGSSALLMASTSSELGGLFADQGHKVAQAYGMFCWAGAVIYVSTAWRVSVEGRQPSASLPPLSPTARTPHFAAPPPRRTRST